MSLVSIITPTYNSSLFISDTIRSIISQSYPFWELIIIDDNSEDSTVEIVKKFQEKEARIILEIQTKNSGAGLARNHGIRIAKGRYIAFCDSDDKWKHDKLEKQIIFMKNNRLNFTYCSYDVISEKGVLLKSIIAPEVLTYNKLLVNNYIGCLTAIYDTKSLGKVYMSKIRRRQDWILWLKILKKIESTKGQSESLAIYRDRTGSISNNKIKMMKYNWYVYSNELGFSFFKSLYFMYRFLYSYARKKIFN